MAASALVIMMIDYRLIAYVALMRIGVTKKQTSVLKLEGNQILIFFHKKGIVLVLQCGTLLHVQGNQLVNVKLGKLEVEGNQEGTPITTKKYIFCDE